MNEPSTNFETDEQLRDRLILLVPEGAWYTAEEVGESSGAFLDELAYRLGTRRQGECTACSAPAKPWDTNMTRGPHFKRIIDGINKGRAEAKLAPLTVDELQQVVHEGFAFEATLMRFFGPNYRLVIGGEGQTIRNKE